jgi:hypothetical protein
MLLWKGPILTFQSGGGWVADQIGALCTAYRSQQTKEWHQGGILSIKQRCFLKKEVFLKQCFSSTLEFQSKMLFFLTLKKVEWKFRISLKKHRFCIDNIPSRCTLSSKVIKHLMLFLNTRFSSLINLHQN